MSHTPNCTLLLVDDDPKILSSLQDIFEGKVRTVTASDGNEAIRLASNDSSIGVVVLDIRMPGKDGITTYLELSKCRPDLRVIFHTGFPGDYSERDIEQSCRPFDYVVKGSSVLRLLRSVRHATESFDLQCESLAWSEAAQLSLGIIGQSKVMQDVFNRIQKVAPTNIRVMLLGETGTGKEKVAKAIHSLSRRSAERFVVFSSNKLEPTLVESELFGHAKGAFTGAIAPRTGLVELADGGTLFLDEIGDLHVDTQHKLLRVIESGEFRPMGCADMRKTDLRVISATNRNLTEMLKEGTFRDDLYFRLKGLQLTLAPLRDRRDDIPLLASSFLDRFTLDAGMPRKWLSTEAMAFLVEQPWPGNVRQLLQFIECLVPFTDSEEISVSQVREVFEAEEAVANSTHSGEGMHAKLRRYRIQLIQDALRETGNDIPKAARILKVDQANLRKEVKSLGILGRNST